MPVRAREAFMVAKEDIFALLHCERLWLKSVALSVHGHPLFVVESEKIPGFGQCDGDDAIYASGI